MRGKFYSVLLLSALLASTGARAVTFTETRTLGPVRASYTELATAVDHLNSFLSKTNGNAPHSTLEISIGKESSQVAFTDRVNPSTAAEAVPIAHVFSYSYSCYDCAAITRVTLEFSDVQRKIAVAGPSFEHVNGLAGLASHQFAPLARGVGGMAARSIAGVVVFCISFVLQCLGALLSLPPIRFPHRWLAMTFSIVGLAMILAYWTAPTNEWFPGVALYGMNPSFMTKYAPEVTFWGAVISIAVSVAGVVISVWMTRKRNKAPN